MTYDISIELMDNHEVKLEMNSKDDVMDFMKKLTKAHDENKYLMIDHDIEEGEMYFINPDKVIRVWVTDLTEYERE